MGFLDNSGDIILDAVLTDHGRKLLAVESLRPKTVKVQTSLEGVFYAPLSKVLLQSEALKTGVGNGEIKKVIVDENNYITHLELYDDFIFTENETNIILVSLNRFNNNFSLFFAGTPDLSSLDNIASLPKATTFPLP